MSVRHEKRSGRAMVCWALALLALAGSAWADEVTVQNDSVSGFGQAVIVGDFIVGEQAGVRLVSPCDGTIVAVQILWLQGTAGNPPSLQEAIHIFADTGNFPYPGTELETLDGPVLTPGYLNEFRYIDEAGTIPLQVPIAAGEGFFVTLEFGEATDVGNGGPSVVRDTDGCTASANVLYGNWGVGTRWWDFCLLLQGDLAIRAVIDCVEPTGACCHLDGTCENGLDDDECAEPGDVWSQGLACVDVDCQPRGACCRQGGCLDNVGQTDCEGPLQGQFAGAGTLCAGDVCVAGACCAPEGTCSEVFVFECDAQGGTFEGPGTSCDPNPCPQPTGACCFGTFCVADQTEDQCGGAGGDWAGAFTTCTPVNPCLAPDCHIVASTPVSGAIDARVPMDVQSPHAPQGWDAVQIEFNAECDASLLEPGDFAVAETCLAGECDGVGPAVSVVSGVGNTATVVLAAPVDPKTWTTISLVAGDPGDEVVLGFLPADSDGSGTANTFDVLTVIDRISEALAGQNPPAYTCDIDRSGTINLTDLLVLVDLLNGAPPFEAYLGKQLP